jgi:hypothetical protein
MIFVCDLARAVVLFQRYGLKPSLASSRVHDLSCTIKTTRSKTTCMLCSRAQCITLAAELCNQFIGSERNRNATSCDVLVIPVFFSFCCRWGRWRPCAATTSTHHTSKHRPPISLDSTTKGMTVTQGASASMRHFAAKPRHEQRVIYCYHGYNCHCCAPCRIARPESTTAIVQCFFVTIWTAALALAAAHAAAKMGQTQQSK